MRKGHPTPEAALRSLAADIEPFARNGTPLPIYLQLEIDALSEEEQDFIYNHIKSKRDSEDRKITLTETNVAALTKCMGMVKPLRLRRFAVYAKKLWGWLW